MLPSGDYYSLPSTDIRDLSDKQKKSIIIRVSQAICYNVIIFCISGKAGHCLIKILL